MRYPTSVSLLVSRPEALLAATFAALIGVGTVLLRLPVSHEVGTVGWLDALFTATSAVCVTGLTTVDTASRYSRFGQTVIVLLIQLGGLGIMTFSALAAQVFRFRLSFTSQVAWQSSFFGEEARATVRRAVGRIVLITVVIELVGAVALYVGLQTARATPVGGWFEAMFLSVSAFCNAGFSVYSDNAVGLRHSGLIIGTLMALIVAGGLGYAVILEILARAWAVIRRARPASVVWTLQSRIVLRVSGLLIVVGAAGLFLAGLTQSEDSMGERVTHALFQSVSARTAGFNTVDIGALPASSLFLLIILMFIGGSPGSCAGGIKTTTAAVWSARVRARMTGRDEVTLFQRRIPHEIVRRAALVLSLAALWNVMGVLILGLTEAGHTSSAQFEHIVFEQISAFGTVGLSAGLTPELSVLGKFWIIATMFVGRLGPLTMALAVLTRPRTLYHYPPERVMVG